MVNSDVFLKKTKALRSAKFIGSFQDLPHYPVLNDDAAKKVLETATGEIRALFEEHPSLRSGERTPHWLRQTQIRLDACLGNGRFSSVYQIKTIRSEDSKIYKAGDLVVKVLRPEITGKLNTLASRLVGLAKEGYILAQLQHEHIIDIQAWTPTGVYGVSSGRADAFFLVLPRLHKTLSDRIDAWVKNTKKLRFAIHKREKKKMSLWEDRLEVILPLADALRHLHERNILHRDVKPDNIGFTSEGVLKLFDFDMARLLPGSAKPDETFELTNYVGSMRYQSPECGLGEKYNCKSDTYAFALICHELISLKKPYADIASGDHHDLVFCTGLRPEIPPGWSEDLVDLIQAGWSRDLSIRPSMAKMHELLTLLVPNLSGDDFTYPNTKGRLRRIPLNSGT